MKSLLLLSALGLSALVSTPARAQLIQNGGFETGDFSNWDFAGTAAVTSGAAGSDYVYAGSHGATLGAGILSQAFLTTPGQVYRVQFYLNTLPLPNDVGLLEIRWGNFDIPNNLDLGTEKLLHSFDSPDPIPDSGWYKYTYDVLALGNVSSLKFEFQTQSVTYPNNAVLDGVSVSGLALHIALPALQGVPIGEPSPELPVGRPYLLASSVAFAPVPEASTYGLFAALALAGLVGFRRWPRSRPNACA